jgi:hypothetical protein
VKGFRIIGLIGHDLVKIVPVLEIMVVVELIFHPQKNQCGTSNTNCKSGDIQDTETFFLQ